MSIDIPLLTKHFFNERNRYRNVNDLYNTTVDNTEISSFCPTKGSSLDGKGFSRFESMRIFDQRDPKLTP